MSEVDYERARKCAFDIERNELYGKAVQHLARAYLAQADELAAIKASMTEIARIVHAPKSYAYEYTHAARIQELSKPFHDGKLPDELTRLSGKGE